MYPNKLFRGHNLKNTGRKQKFGYARKYAILMGNFHLRIFTFSPVAYIKVELKKVVSDLFHQLLALWKLLQRLFYCFPAL